MLRRWIDSFLALALFLSGCAAPNILHASPTSQTIPTLSPLPQITATRTLRPTVTPRPTATVTPTLTSLPSLSPQEAGQEIARLMQTNNDCEGNCVWGFRAGESRYDEALHYLKSIDAVDKEEIGEQRQLAWVSFNFRDYAWGGMQLSAEKKSFSGFSLMEVG